MKNKADGARVFLSFRSIGKILLTFHLHITPFLYNYSQNVKSSLKTFYYDGRGKGNE